MKRVPQTVRHWDTIFPKKSFGKQEMIVKGTVLRGWGKSVKVFQAQGQQKEADGGGGRDKKIKAKRILTEMEIYGMTNQATAMGRELGG